MKSTPSIFNWILAEPSPFTFFAVSLYAPESFELIWEISRKIVCVFPSDKIPCLYFVPTGIAFPSSVHVKLGIGSAVHRPSKSIDSSNIRTCGAWVNVGRPLLPCSWSIY